MDWGTLAQWAGVVAAIGLSIWSARSKHSEETLSALRKQIDDKAKDAHRAIADVAGDVKTIAERIDRHEVRIASIEGDLRHLPSKENTHRLETAVERLEGRIGILDEALKPVARIADRLQEFLLDQARVR